MRLPIILFLVFLGQSCSHLFYQPSSKHFVDPAQFKLKYNDIYFDASDGTKLHGWFFPAKSTPKGTIVQFHGNAQNISTHFFSLIWLTDQGYNLFTFDYRGYAKSEGYPDQKGLYKDSLAAFDKAWELHEKNGGGGTFVIYGQSMGGAVSLRAIPDWVGYERISLIVMDSAFDSYRDIAFDKMTDRWFLYPLAPISLLAVSDAYAADEVFHKITKPTLVIVGEGDKVVPAKFGRRIFKGIKTREKWLWELPEGSHIDVYHHGQEKYRKPFLDLLEKLAK